jgi:iron complex transport system permease protein
VPRETKVRLRGDGEGNAYRAQQQGLKGMRPEARRVRNLGIAFAVTVVLAMVLPIYFTGQHALIQLTLSRFLDVCADNLAGLVGVFTGNTSASFEMRFCGVVVCAVSGGALGLCGSTYQGAFNNPLAAPKTLGVMSGGALGALIWVFWGARFLPKFYSGSSYTQADFQEMLSSLDPLSYLWVFYGKAICSTIGCFLIVGIVVFIASLIGRGRLSNIVVIIVGQVFSVAVSAIIQFARYLVTSTGHEDLADEIASIENYTMMSSYGFQDLLFIVVPIVACMAVVLALRNRFTLLSFGDEEAQTMGVNVNRTRYLMIAVCTLMVGLAISFCGHVAFLGFISAHIARKIVGPDFRFLLPASIFVGGGFLTAVQWVCYSGLPLTNEYAAGSVVSVVGAAIFLVLAVREGRRLGSEWG